MKFDIYTTKEFCLITENKPGALYKISAALGDHGVNVESISAFASPDGKAVFHIITNDVETTKKAMEHVSDVGIDKKEESDVIVVRLENRPGELAKVADKLHRHGVNLHSVYILRTGDKTEVAIKPNDFSKAVAVLKGDL